MIFEAAKIAKPQLDELDCVMMGLFCGPLTLAYQVVVNVASFLSFATHVPLWKYVWAGVAFAAVQIVWNAALFFVTLPPMLRVLARVRRELVGRAAV